jgi:hypothetical protein
MLIEFYPPRKTCFAAAALSAFYFAPLFARLFARLTSKALGGRRETFSVHSLSF